MHRIPHYPERIVIHTQATQQEARIFNKNVRSKVVVK